MSSEKPDYKTISAERPCKECKHYKKTRYLKCGRSCNFNHDSFERDETESRRKQDQK